MELKHEKITRYIPAIFLAVVNGNIKSGKLSSSFFVFRPCMCTSLSVAHQRKKQAQRKTHI